MPHVWIINQAALGPRDSGGTRHYSLAKTLLAHGWQVTIIREAGQQPAGQETLDGVTFLRLPGAMNKRTRFNRLTSMLGFAHKLLSSPLPPAPDIIIGSSPPLFAAFAAARLATRYRVPFVLEVRDLWPDSLIDIADVPRWHPLVLVMRWMEHRLYTRADAIVPLFTAAIPYFEKHGVARAKITPIPNGIDTNLYGVPAAPSARDRFTIYYVGALGLPNGLELLLDAAALLQAENAPIDVCIVGDGVRKTVLQHQAQHLRHVRFLPSVPKEQMAATLANADAFFLCVLDRPIYRYGASPNKLYDYLFAARPVVFATAQHHLVEAQHAVGITVPPDAASIARGVKELAAMTQEERVAMGQRGREFVLQHHDMAQLGEKLSSLLTSLLRPRSE